MTKAQKTEREEAIERLREALKPGDTVYCILRHRSASGMSRVIQLVSIGERNGKPCILSLGYNIAIATERKYDREREGVKIGGCGMDMGFALVYDLGHALWPDGTPEPHGTRNGEPDSEGGYALKHSWL